MEIQEKPGQALEGELIGYELTEKQAGVLPAAIEDAKYFRDHAEEMTVFMREEINRAVHEDAEEWRIAGRSERLRGYELEYFRASRLVAFLEKLNSELEG